jgi:dienelactone hydrolase
MTPQEERQPMRATVHHSTVRRPPMVATARGSAPRRSLRGRGTSLAAIVIALALAAPAAQGEAFPEPPGVVVLSPFPPVAFAAGDLAGTLTRPSRPSWEGPHPAVVLVHDADSADPRGDLYAEQLAGAGFVVLDLLSHPADPDAARRARDWLAAQPEVDPSRIAGVGFGAGAQAVLAVGFSARVLLYPGCARLAPATATAPTLLAHGGADPANPEPACALAADRLASADDRVRLIVYHGAGYAWDHPRFGASERVLLPSPLGAARVPAAPWPALAEAAASEVAGFLAVVLRGRGR